MPAIGVVVGHNDLTLYFSGDTQYNQKLEELKKHNIDVMFICINGKLGNMNATEAVRLTEKINPKVAIPTHYGMFESNTENPKNYTSKLRCGFEMEYNREYDIQMNCNVKSSYLLMMKYSKAMKEKGWGRIVTIGSVNQYNQHPELSLYGVTKAAQYKLVQNIAPYLAPFGVTVNNVAPGAVNTPRNKDLLKDENFRKNVERNIPVGYIAEPKDITPAVLLLCSEEGRYITGTEIIIDGGMSL